MAIHRCTTCDATFTQLRRLHAQEVYLPLLHERFATRELRDQHLATHVRTVGTQTNNQANLGCHLLIPTRYRRAVPEYHGVVVG